MAEFLTAGVDCYIDGLGIVDANGDPLDVTGYAVEAVARDSTPDGEILARWSTDSILSDGTGEAIAGGVVPDRVRLVVTAEQTESWQGFVVIQAEMVSQSGQRSRPIDTVYQVKSEAVV